MLTSDTVGLVSWQTPASSGSQPTLDVTPIPAGTTGTYTPDYNALKICQFGACCPPWKDCDGDTKTYQAGNDCDEGCATCYVGSASYTYSPSGRDLDCNGVVDEIAGDVYALYVTASEYKGNLGGRVGADAKCDADANKITADCIGAAKAFISVTAVDEVADFPTTWNIDTSRSWWWVNNGARKLVANNWIDLLDGTILNAGSSVGFLGGYNTGSTSAGALWGTYHCANWTSDTAGYVVTGLASSTGASWLGVYQGVGCSTARNLLCGCLQTLSNYR